MAMGKYKIVFLIKFIYLPGTRITMAIEYLKRAI